MATEKFIESGLTVFQEAFPHHRCMWQTRPAGMNFSLTCYMVGGIIVIIQDFKGTGWEAFIPAHHSNSALNTLDAIRRAIAAATPESRYNQERKGEAVR